MKFLAPLFMVLSLVSSLYLVRAQKESKNNQSAATPNSTGKTKRELSQEAQLRALFSKVGVSVEVESRAKNNQPQTLREVTLRWSDSIVSNGARSSANAQGNERASNISVLEDKKRFGALPRRRSLELSPTQIVIGAVDKKNQLRWWTILADPRVVRSEFQTATGDLRSEDHYLSSVTLVVAFPDDPRIVALRFYHPLSTGTDLSLEPIAIVPVP